LVTKVLLLAIPLHQLRLRFPTLPLVVGVFLAPFLPAIAHHLAILRICHQLPAAGIGAASALALRLTANSLLGTTRRRQKGTLAVKTTTGLAHRGLLRIRNEILEENRNPVHVSKRNQQRLRDHRRKPASPGVSRKTEEDQSRRARYGNFSKAPKGFKLFLDWWRTSK
jgi:hypothetical protein